MKRIFCMLLIAITVFSTLQFTASAEEINGQTAAEKLHALGLLAGVGHHPDGTVDFDVDGNLSRAQAIVQVVRFYGVEADAKAQTNAHPFKDVPAWAVPYVSYAYANGFTKGVTDTTFDCDSRMSDMAFLTFVLRVLGYNDGEGDFVWNDPYTLAKEVGLIDSTAADGNFTRGDAFIICYRALTAKPKTGECIKDSLIKRDVFTERHYAVVTGGVNYDRVLTVDDLNTKAYNGSHAEDDFRTAHMELNSRKIVEINEDTTGQSRYNNAFYPRIKKIRDDKYLMLWMSGQLGAHLYWSLSSDGVNWDAPEVFYNANLNNFTHTFGPLEGKADRFVGYNADAVVLENGEVLAVYYRRAGGAFYYDYAPYFDMTGIYVVRGNLDENDKMVWGEPLKIYTGNGWEPYIHRTPEGVLQVFWSATQEHQSRVGYDMAHRSTYVMMTESYDNGYTWVPHVKEGDQNHYVAIRVFKEDIGLRVPDLRDDTIILEPMTYYGGQMPAVTTLYNGKSLLAVEISTLNEGFEMSFAISEENGKWKPLGEKEVGPETSVTQPFFGAGPYLATFPSGEVYLSHHWAHRYRYRLGSPDGTEWSELLYAQPGNGGTKGVWGSSILNSSHEVITAFQVSVDETRFGIELAHSYLNHRTNASRMVPTVDGNASDWRYNTDALFVGSETQAQITQQVAHDKDNVYFLFNRLDEHLTDGDTVAINIATGKMQYYRIEVGFDGIRSVTYVDVGEETKLAVQGKAVVKPFGTLNNNNDVDEGAVYEIAIPKALVGLTGATSFKTCPALENQDGVGSVYDTLTGVGAFITDLWPEVVLD